jgi:hypothetical protein
MFEIMNYFRITTMLITLVSAATEKTKAHVKKQNNLTDHFEVNRD